MLFLVAVNALLRMLFRRFGLLTLFTGFAVLGITRSSPLLISSWFGGFSLTLALLLVGIAAWCVWVILSASERLSTDSAA
jgi:hypothetical protein